MTRHEQYKAAGRLWALVRAGRATPAQVAEAERLEALARAKSPAPAPVRAWCDLPTARVCWEADAQALGR